MRQMMRILGVGVILLVCAACSSSASTSPTAPPPTDPVAAWAYVQQQIAASDDPAAQQQLVDRFLADHPVSPLTSNDQAVFLVQRADADGVLLAGDMNNWLSPTPLSRVGRTDVWALTQTYSPTARLDYKFGLSGGRGLFNDPRNPNISIGGFGRNSELRMPAYVPPAEVEPRSDIAHGNVEALGLYHSNVASTTHDLNVYLPAGYDSAQRYPTVYFQDGDDYLAFANAPTIFDNAIADGTLPPLIGVFVTPSEEQGRLVDYDFNDAYVQFFATELVPLIDSTYSTRTDPSSRVIVGDSYGGLISLYIAWQYPDLFGGVVNQSGYTSRSNGRIISLLTAQPALNLRISTVAGTFETCVLGIGTGSECNFLAANRTLHTTLEALGYAQQYAEYPQGHSWGFWRDHIDEPVAWALNWQH